MGGFVPSGGGLVVFDIEGVIDLVVFAVLMVIKIFAFVTSLLYSSESYVAADKLNKATWCILLGVSVALQVVPLPIQLINLVFVVVSCVFLADVRPALAGLRRR